MTGTVVGHLTDCLLNFQCTILQLTNEIFPYTGCQQIYYFNQFKQIENIRTEAWERAPNNRQRKTSVLHGNKETFLITINLSVCLGKPYPILRHVGNHGYTALGNSEVSLRTPQIRLQSCAKHAGSIFQTYWCSDLSLFRRTSKKTVNYYCNFYEASWCTNEASCSYAIEILRDEIVDNTGDI